MQVWSAIFSKAHGHQDRATHFEKNLENQDVEIVEN